jgi:nitrate reductase NapE component
MKDKEITVATYCGKCGSEVPSDKQFCATCGTPVAVSAPSAAPTAAYAPVPAGTPVTAYAPVPSGVPVAAPYQPAAAPAKSGSSALKIILIVIAIFIGLGVLGAGAFGFMVWRIAHAVHVSGSGNQATLNLPGGSITTNTTETYSASELGTDIYPGATSGKGGMRMNFPTGSMITAIYVTSDPKEQVVNFYKAKLGSDASVFDSGTSAVMSVKRSNQESIMITISANPSQDEGKTKIAITHTKTTKSD